MTEVLVQVNEPEIVPEAVGGVIFCNTLMLAVEVQPLTGFVTTSVYAPGVVVVTVAVVALKLPGPDQLKLTPGVGEPPVNVTDVVVQVSGPDTAALAPGDAMSCSTSIVSDPWQPLTVLVTTNT